MRNLISKIESNKQFYILFANQCRYELAQKYKTQMHPDGRSLIVKGVSYDTMSKICKKYGCSGMMVGDNDCIVTNFGYYK